LIARTCSCVEGARPFTQMEFSVQLRRDEGVKDTKKSMRRGLNSNRLASSCWETRLALEFIELKKMVKNEPESIFEVHPSHNLKQKESMSYCKESSVHVALKLKERLARVPTRKDQGQKTTTSCL
jgi:hypothetical protein